MIGRGAAAILLSALLAKTTHAAPQPSDTTSQIERGAYLALLGDCAGCHTAKGGRPLAGGYALQTRFGTIYSTNITPDSATGIGTWTPDQFQRAVQHGVRPDGAHLYPALPYPYFARAELADIEAIRLWLMGQPSVSQAPRPNKISFPFNLRGLLQIWNALNYKQGVMTADPARSSEWSRGAYIVNGLGHCGACHTPKNILGGDKLGLALKGGEVELTRAPDLTNFAKWSADDIAAYLRTGRNEYKEADGPMAEVIRASTSKFSAADLRAVAIYLKSLSGGA